MDDPFKFNKGVDLHESEWSHEKKPEPFLGSGFYWFSRVWVPTAVAGVIAYFVFSRLVDTMWP